MSSERFLVPSPTLPHLLHSPAHQHGTATERPAECDDLDIVLKDSVAMSQRSGGPGSVSNSEVNDDDPGEDKAMSMIHESDDEMDLEENSQALRKINKRTKPCEENVQTVVAELRENVRRIKQEMEEKNRLIQECLSGIKKDKEELAYVERMLKEVEENAQEFQTVKKSRRSSRKVTEKRTVKSVKSEETVSQKERDTQKKNSKEPGEDKVMSMIHESDDEMDLEEDSQALRKINKRTKPCEENVQTVVAELRENVRRIKQEMEEKNRLIQECLSGIKKDKEELAYVERMLKGVEEKQEFQTIKKSRRSSRKVTEKRTVKSVKSQETLSQKERDTQKKNSKEHEGKKRWYQNQRGPPPIVLREQGRLSVIRKEAEANNIKIVNSRITKEGVKIHTESAEDFRKLRRLLEGKNVPFHTFQLNEEKALKVVLRGIPTDFSEEDVQGELEEQGFPVLKVKRMKRFKEQGFPVLKVKRMKRFKEDMPMMLADVKKSDEGKNCSL
ncbi:hypothetical protein QE152_g27025 [Popillia japonica]|uniref:Uncharacterized protein n=1 Tax=Popillia japonica TaxID=7064 RepID=A0AAW1JXG2_POPJA